MSEGKFSFLLYSIGVRSAQNRAEDYIELDEDAQGEENEKEELTQQYSSSLFLCQPYSERNSRQA